MKKMPYLILIGEIIAICVLHALKSNHLAEATPSVIDRRDKKLPVDSINPVPTYMAFHYRPSEGASDK